MSKIILRELTFSNMFSYGANNVIRLDGDTLVQLVGKNGVGKSTIVLIIQELLYSKNVKGVKKPDILNRGISAKNWEGSLLFDVDEKSYRITVKRVGATSKVTLLENDVDISEHKVPDTYKKLSDLLNLEFSIFSQLTYQSSSDLLDFLKATDTNRKKFLINLFNLEKYINIGELVKAELSKTEKALSTITSELSIVQSFLNSVTIPELLYEKAVITPTRQYIEELASITTSLANITETCKRIDKNNLLVKELKALQFDIGMPEPERFDETNLNSWLYEIKTNENALAQHKKDILSLNTADSCKTCGQPIDNSHVMQIKSSLEQKIAALKTRIELDVVILQEMQQERKANETAVLAYGTNKRSIERFEQLSQLIDNALPSTHPSYTDLINRQKELESLIRQEQQTIKEVTEYNKNVSANNAKIAALTEQKLEFLTRQQAINSDKITIQDKVNKLTLLKKAFSPTGIVAYKLENLTKELEDTINNYLQLLSDGQFQIEFVLDKEKLNINVINNGLVSPLETMSGGEFSRIQTSVLLAIRTLLTKLGNSSVNLLFLDEIMAVLDDSGKEGLIEALQKERDLNVFLISHEFTHPLIPQINITKEDNISKIAN